MKKNFNILLFFILLTQMTQTSFSQIRQESIHNLFKDDFYDQQDCNTHFCLTIADSIQKSRKQGLQNKTRALEVYKAREYIKVKLGNIIPSLNLKIVTDPKDLLEMVPNLLGFLFPSNWYRWKESKIFSKVEELTFKNLLANEAHTLESLYLTIHQHILLQKFLGEHTKFLTLFYKDLEKREEFGEVALEDLEKSKSLVIEWDLKEIYLTKGLEEINNRFSQVINYGADWDSLPLKLLKLPSLNNQEELFYDDFIQSIKEMSLEIKSLKMLKMASKYAKKARMWSFLSPHGDSDSAFGFGLIGHYRIAKAKEKELDLKLSLLKLNLKETLKKVIRDHNASLAIYRKAQDGLQSIQVVLEALVEDYNTSGQINFGELEDTLSKTIEFKMAKVQAQHNYLRSLSKLDRLLHEGPYYQNLDSFLPPKKDHKFKFLDYRRRENKKIEKDIKKGLLPLNL